MWYKWSKGKGYLSRRTRENGKGRETEGKGNDDNDGSFYGKMHLIESFTRLSSLYFSFSFRLRKAWIPLILAHTGFSEIQSLDVEYVKLQGREFDVLWDVSSSRVEEWNIWDYICLFITLPTHSFGLMIMITSTMQTDNQPFSTVLSPSLSFLLFPRAYFISRQSGLWYIQTPTTLGIEERGKGWPEHTSFDIW